MAAGKRIDPGAINVALFWEKVRQDAPETCWPWLASKNKNGYGLFGVGNGCRLAHRVAYSIAHGAIEGDLLVCHSCDNPACVNPNHLWLGTDRDNMRDMIRKGRDNGISTREKCKTHCSKGHSLSGDNIWKSRRERICKTCHKERQRAYKNRQSVSRIIERFGEKRTCLTCRGAVIGKLNKIFCSKRCQEINQYQRRLSGQRAPSRHIRHGEAAISSAYRIAELKAKRS